MKWRIREIKKLAQTCTTSMRYNWDSNPGQPYPSVHAPSFTLHCPRVRGRGEKYWNVIESFLLLKRFGGCGGDISHSLNVLLLFIFPCLRQSMWLVLVEGLGTDRMVPLLGKARQNGCMFFRRFLPLTWHLWRDTGAEQRRLLTWSEK